MSQQSILGVDAVECDKLEPEFDLAGLPSRVDLRHREIEGRGLSNFERGHSAKKLRLRDFGHYCR
jgi:hypothetical protein